MEPVVPWGWFKDMDDLLEREYLIKYPKIFCVVKDFVFFLGGNSLFIFSIIVNLACSLNLCPGFWKCLSHERLAALHTPFLLILILKLILYSDLPIYQEFVKRQHFMRKIIQLLLYVIKCLISNIFCAIAL